jgi:hypothetical protein
VRPRHLLPQLGQPLEVGLLFGRAFLLLQGRIDGRADDATIASPIGIMSSRLPVPDANRKAIMVMSGMIRPTMLCAPLALRSGGAGRSSSAMGSSGWMRGGRSMYSRGMRSISAKIHHERREARSFSRFDKPENRHLQ